MKDTLKPGIESEFKFHIPESKTVPALYPESAEFQEMPEVFATGFLVGFLEWACIKAINPHQREIQFKDERENYEEGHITQFSGFCFTPPVIYCVRHNFMIKLNYAIRMG